METYTNVTYVQHVFQVMLYVTLSFNVYLCMCGDWDSDHSDQDVDPQ
jgi:hypothetical protein